MTEVNVLKPYRDDCGNEIVYSGRIDRKVIVNFRGNNNKVIIAKGSKIMHLNLQFDANNSTVTIGSHKGVGPLRLYARIGQDCMITMGDNVSMTDKLSVTVAEGTSITLGNDVMVAADVEIRADDAHPIFDIYTEARVNPAKSVRIGNHVWLAKRSVIMGGVQIGDGSIVGLGTILTKSIPNNCIAAGVPGKVIRRNIAWERPHLGAAEPFYKPDASTVTKSRYWNPTLEPVVAPSPDRPLLRLRKKAWRMRHRLLNRT